MHVFITFYSKNGTHLSVSNSFSFGRELFPQPYCDVFIDRNCPDLDKIPKNAEKYYISAVFKQDLEIVSSLINERWIIGGPLVKMVQCLHNQIPCNCIQGNYEISLFGQNTLSNNFTNYWEDLETNAKSIEFNYSLSGDCYWSKCSFCSHKRLTKFDSMSRDISGILNITCTVPTTIYPCKPSLTVKDLRFLLENPTNFCIDSFVRADKIILKTINDIKYPIYCKNKTFSIGLESPSETIRNQLGKGETDDDILKLSEFFVKNGGNVIWSIMDEYAFMNKKNTDEALTMINRMSELNQRYPNQISIIYNSATGWYSSEEAKKFSNNFSIQKVHIKSGPIEYDRYWICLPIDSEEFYNNFIIDTKLDKCGFKIVGFERISHQYYKLFKNLCQYKTIEIGKKSYIEVIIKTGNSLSGLFGTLWKSVYYANINEEFRQKCPNPNKISVGQILYFPIFPKDN